MPGLSWKEVLSRTEAAEGYRRVGGLILSRLLVGSFGAGTRPPINLDGNGGPEPEALLASSRAAIKGLLPGASVCCPALIGDQAYSLVLDCREAVIPPTFRELGEGVADVTDQALHYGQYGCLKIQVNQPCGPDSKNPNGFQAGRSGLRHVGADRTAVGCAE
jgi:hypothetical protein